MHATSRLPTEPPPSVESTASNGVTFNAADSLRPPWDDTQALAVLREAETQLQLDHPGMVEIQTPFKKKNQHKNPRSCFQANHIPKISRQ